MINMETTAIVSICTNGTVLGLIIWIAINQVKRIDKCEEENKEIKVNYLDRFDKVNNHLADIKGNISTLLERTKEL